MGRRREFDEDAVLDAAAMVFVRSGYEGTSIDDLVTALDLRRGSLYQAFGSKRGLFVATLRRHVEVQVPTLLADAVRAGDGARPVPGGALDLILVAALERGPADAEIADLVRTGVELLGTSLGSPGATVVDHAPVFTALGARLYERLHPDAASAPASTQPAPRPAGATH